MKTLESAIRENEANAAKFNPQYSTMTLRDYFAAKAMQGLLCQSMGSALSSEVKGGAEYAYKMADAMLEARKQ